MEIILIAAIAKNRVIGRDGKMPWHIPEELQHFKKTTMGHPLIMGRKTFESFPSPLPGRRHIVLSRNRHYLPRGGEYASSLRAALDLCGEGEKVFIIGGSQIFRQGLAVASGMILTLIHREAAGDTTFPEFSNQDFFETDRNEYPNCSDPFTIVTYRRIKADT